MLDRIPDLLTTVFRDMDRRQAGKHEIDATVVKVVEEGQGDIGSFLGRVGCFPSTTSQRQFTWKDKQIRSSYESKVRGIGRVGLH